MTIRRGWSTATELAAYVETHHHITYQPNTFGRWASRAADWPAGGVERVGQGRGYLLFHRRKVLAWMEQTGRLKTKEGRDGRPQKK